MGEFYASDAGVVGGVAVFEVDLVVRGGHASRHVLEAGDLCADGSEGVLGDAVFEDQVAVVVVVIDLGLGEGFGMALLHSLVKSFLPGIKSKARRASVRPPLRSDTFATVRILKKLS